MSAADTVDDLHAAEDFAGTAVAALDRLLAASPVMIAVGEMADAITNARSVIASWRDYCRPTCGANGNPDNDDECEEGDTCGCPCAHAE